MGTRGTFGVVVEEKEKISYNHWDSYPEGLGLSVLAAARRIASDYDNYRVQAAKLRLVGEDKTPTERQIKQLERFSDTMVSSGKKTEWYVLLRNLQGDLLGTLDVGYMIDGRAFTTDGLFCEWGWIVNFDEKTLECYRGFVKDGEIEGRFKDDIPSRERGDPYQPIHLLGTFSLNELPEDHEFIHTVKEWYNNSAEKFGEEYQYEPEDMEV